MKKLLLFLILIPQYAVAQLVFSPNDTLHHGNYHSKKPVLIYDHNKDGFDDILYFDKNEIFLKNHHSYSYQNDSSIFSYSRRISGFSETVDFNNDGLLDFGLATHDHILLFKGTSNGIELYKDIETNIQWTEQLNLIDVDFDGDQDIVFGVYHSIVLMLNEGDESFSSPNTIYQWDESSFGYELFRIGDIDDDKDMDLIVFGMGSDYSFKIYQCMNSGDFTFDQNLIYQPEMGELFYTGHFNDDDLLDIVMIEGFSKIAVLGYDHTNGYQVKQLIEDKYNHMTGGLVYDENNDGIDDFILSNGEKEVMLLLGKGDGTFLDGVQYKSSVALFREFQAGNFNGDGKVNFYGISFTDDYVTVLPNGAQNPHDSIIHLPFSPTPAKIEFADLDDDGYRDIISFCDNGGIFVSYGAANHVYQRFELIYAQIGIESGIVLDMNNDDKPDLVFTNNPTDYSRGDISWLENLGQRTFGTPQLFRRLFDPIIAGICDYNKDGIIEIMAFQENGGVVCLFSTDNPDVEEITSDNPNIIDIPYLKPVGMSAHDMNGDGWTDIIVGNADPGRVSLFINNKVGGFESELFIHSAIRISGAAAGDINSDEVPEIMVGAIEADQSGTLLVFEFDKDLDKYEVIYNKNFEGGYETLGPIEIIDMDNQGHSEIVASGSNNNNTYYFRTSDENAIEHYHTESFGKKRSLVIMDCNDDLLPDLLSSDHASGGAYLNYNETVFEPAVLKSTIKLENIAPETIEVTLNQTTYSGRLILMKANEKIQVLPEDGINYPASTNYGSGAHIDADAYAVYTGPENTITISGLEGKKYYHAAAFEFNQHESQTDIINYLTSVFASDSIYVKAGQTIQWSGPLEFTTDDESFEVNVSASSGLPVDISLVSGPLSFDGSMATINGIGEAIFQVTQVGNNDYFGVDSLFSVNIQEITHLKDEEYLDINIYPNPFRNEIVISGKKLELINRVRLLDLSGKTIFEKYIGVDFDNETLKLSIPGITEGLYVIEIEGPEIMRQKMIRQEGIE